MNALLVTGIFSGWYLLLFALGAAIVKPVTRGSAITFLLAPTVGLCLFGIIATALMYHFDGKTSGRSALIVSCLIAAAATWRVRKQWRAATRVRDLRLIGPGIVSGVLFLAPLLIANDHGLFSANGGDFGSYAGWAKHFLNITLSTPAAADPGINPTLDAFRNLQNELTSPNGGWRVGNISFYTALNAISPVEWLDTYSAVSAVMMGAFVSAMMMFTRFALLQSWRTALVVGYAGAALNSIVWLLSAHYGPNVLGLTLVLELLALTLWACRAQRKPYLVTAILLSGLLLMYVESLAFLAMWGACLLLAREIVPAFGGASSAVKARMIGLVTHAGIAALISAAMVTESLGLVTRHFWRLSFYSRPGDFVGIERIGYALHVIGIIDYDAVLKGNVRYGPAGFLLAAIIIVGLVLTRFVMPPDRARRAGVRMQMCRGLLLAVVVGVLLGAMKYALSENLLAWRIFMMLSPLTMMLFVIAIVSAAEDFRAHDAKRHTPLWRYATIAALIACVVPAAQAIVYRTGLVLRTARPGHAHTMVFGSGFLDLGTALERMRPDFDLAIVNHAGTGTLQAGWEIHLQDVPYVFAASGVGNNEFAVSGLVGKRIVVIEDAFPKVYRLEGFDSDIRSFGGNRTIASASNTDALVPFSSTWKYIGSEYHLLLPGVPGKMLLWSTRERRACLDLRAVARRAYAALKVEVGDQRKLFRDISDGAYTACFQFTAGLNAIRFVPVNDAPDVDEAIKAEIARLMEESDELEVRKIGLGVLTGRFQAVDPLRAPMAGSDWRDYNLGIPPDRAPYPPHLIIKSLVLRAEKL